MGEMIKFGIKLAMTIACAVALVAAIAILFDLISSLISNLSVVNELLDFFTVFSLFIPINVNLLFVTLTSLFSFKVAYWAADKMIQFISASS